MKTYLNLLVVFAILCWQSNTILASEQYHIENLGIMSGLSDGDVLSITQDSRGQIWVATANGLNRFDGTDFINFTMENSGLGSNALNCVTQLPNDPDRLWIGSQRDGIFYYDHASGEIHGLTHPVQISTDVTTITPASDSGMWVNYYHFGPQYINFQTGESREYTYRKIPGMPKHCWTTTEGKDGKLYVGHAGEGFSVVDTVQKKVVTFRHQEGKPSIPGNEVYSVCVDKDDDVWLGTDKGAALYLPKQNLFIPFTNDENNPNSILPGRIRHIAQDRNGNIWFASTLAGVCMLPASSSKADGYSKAKFTRIPTNGFSLYTSNEYARTIYPDSFGNIWIGNHRTGLSVINHISPGISRIEYIGKNNSSSPYLPTWSCAYSQDGTLWVGGVNEIAQIKDGKTKHIPIPYVSDIAKTYVKALTIDRKGRVWIGTYDRGAMIYNPSNQSFIRVENINPDVKVFTETPDGDMLIGTDKGLYRCHNGLPHGEYDNNINISLSDLVIMSVIIDDHGNYWIGTFGKGVFILNSSFELQSNLGKQEGLLSNTINSILQDSSGRIWLATRAGVTMIPNLSNLSSFTNITETTNRYLQIKSLEEDNFHNIWFSHSRGIGKINPENNTTKLYQYSNTLPIHTFIDNGATRDDNGNILFASSNGLFEINPTIILSKKDNIPAKVTDFSVFQENNESDNNSYSIPIFSDIINLSHNQNTFSITFNVLDHAIASISEFQCSLEGIDKGWLSPSSSKNKVLFRNLKPGTYKLYVRQRQEGNEWGAPQNIMTIHIAPPIWLTWWAKILYLIIAVSLIAYCMRLYRNWINLQQQVSLLEETDRNRSELNEERMRFFTNITHELRTPLTLILGPLEELVSDPKLPASYSGKLQMIRNSSTQLLNLINGILEFRKTETQNRRLKVKSGNLPNLLREIGLNFKELNHNKDVEIILDIDDDSSDSLFDPEIITIIINNIMINALKYTQMGEIRLSCHIININGKSTFEIKISDTDYGISKDKLPHIFERYYQANDTHQASGTGIGLALVKSLIDIHEATIDVESEPGEGSVFTIRLLHDNLYPDALHGDNDTSARDKTAEEQDADNPVEKKERQKVLIVEDNFDLRKYMCQCLENQFQVLTAENGLDGLRCAHEDTPDIIVTDIMMPEMDGIEMCRNIKADILTSHIPIVMLTAKDSITDKQEGYEAGASSYLTKPFTAKLLLARINNILRLQRNMAEHLRMLSLSNPVDKQIKENPSDNNPNSTKSAGNGVNISILSPLDREFLEKIVSTINKNISNPDLGVNFLADKMCMSNSTLYRKVMAVLGVSTNEYIRTIRLQKAKELLMERKLSITDIAFETGFSTHSSFAKAFKKEFGITASEFLHTVGIRTEE